MQKLLLQRGPLPEPLRAQAIAGWSRYDARLADEREWALEFEKGPAGPAVHAVVIDGAGRLTGHHCAIPLHLRYEGETLVVAKGEALYVEEDSRDAPASVDGRLLRPAAALTRGLYERLGEFGFRAYFGYATPAAERRHVASGCVVVRVPYRRFVDARLALRRLRLRSPHQAAAGGSNSQPAGGWAEVTAFEPAWEEGFRRALDPERLAFDPSAPQLTWRFPPSLYRLFVLGAPARGYAVVSHAHGRPGRVVDSAVAPADVGAVPALVSTLRREGLEPDWNAPDRTLARALAKARLLRDPRRLEYRLVVFGASPFTDPDRWRLTLAPHERF